MSVQKNGQQIIKVTRNKQTGMWEIPLETQQSKVVVNEIMDQTTKTITVTVSPCLTFHPNNKKPLQVNQADFPQDFTRPRRGVNKEASGKIDKKKLDTYTL